jgi:hypothetical protein
MENFQTALTSDLMRAKQPYFEKGEEPIKNKI